MSDEDMNDEEFLNYCRAHSLSDRALFHIDYVKRLLKLAGMELPGHTQNNDFIRIDRYEMKEILKKVG